MTKPKRYDDERGIQCRCCGGVEDCDPQCNGYEPVKPEASEQEIMGVRPAEPVECEGCRTESWCRGGSCANNTAPSGARAE